MQQAGVGLVEVLVSLGLTLVIVIAATSAYLATRETQQTVDQAGDAHESAAFALRLLGRELMNAGFYPLVRTETAAASNTLAGYLNITGRPAYDTGLFGCEGAAFRVDTGVCDPAVAGQSDALVVGYFTNDAFGTTIGQRADCNGNDVGTAPVNVTRVGGGPASLPPQQPLFVANHYRLVDETVTVNGATTVTRSLVCRGNAAASSLAQPIVTGLDDLQLTYGVFDDESLTVDRYLTAAAVSALPAVTINGRTVNSGWARVSTVRVCVVGRTYQTVAAIAPAAGAPLTWTACDGSIVTQAASDRSVRRTYVQVFGVRNRQTATY